MQNGHKLVARYVPNDIGDLLTLGCLCCRRKAKPKLEGCLLQVC